MLDLPIPTKFRLILSTATQSPLGGGVYFLPPNDGVSDRRLAEGFGRQIAVAAPVPSSKFASKRDFRLRH